MQESRAFKNPASAGHSRLWAAGKVGQVVGRVLRAGGWGGVSGGVQG